MKMMEFDEYWNYWHGAGVGKDKVSEGVRGFYRDAHWNTWNAARVGMVPEDECVRFPKVEEWPSNKAGRAKGVSVHYTWREKVEEEFIHSVEGVCELIAYIQRPTPAWTPNLHDRVFFCNGSAPAVVCLVTKVDGPMFGIVGPGVDKLAGINWLKPFAPDNIGKPWEEIPNA